jgi:hypothetical protein
MRTGEGEEERGRERERERRRVSEHQHIISGGEVKSSTNTRTSRRRGEFKERKPTWKYTEERFKCAGKSVLKPQRIHDSITPV